MKQGALSRLVGRAALWLRILNRLRGTSPRSQVGLVASALSDTVTFAVHPASATSPKACFSGVVRSREFGCSWHVRRDTDDIYNVMPVRERDVHDVILGELRLGDVFIDVGANVGYYTVRASGLVGPGGVVVAVEPVPETAEVLEANCCVNGLANVRIRREAAWCGETAMEIFVSNGHFGQASATTHLGESVLVKAIRLDSVCEPYGAIRMLKIDVEGSEYEVLCGATATLRKTQYVVLECSERCEMIRELLSREFSLRRLVFGSYWLAERRDAGMVGVP